MKKLLTVIAITLGINFLAAVGGIAWLFKTGKLDQEKVHTIKELVFAPATQPAAPVENTDRDPTTQPTIKLDELLAKVSGRPAGEQIEFIQRTFDSQMTILDRKKQELISLQNTVDATQKSLSGARDSLKKEQALLSAAQAQQSKALTDQGFADTLNLYNTLPAKQVKTIFMTLDDPTMILYLRAMEPRVAGKIIKEFKSADEGARLAKVMEKMRQSQASAKE